MIPTQLRDCLIGVRNAGMKITGIVSSDPTKDPSVLDTSYHSGTITHLGKKCGTKENRRIAAMNARQMQFLTGKPIHFVSLNAEFNPTGNDNQIVRNTANAMKQNGFSHSNLCFNRARLFTPNRYGGIEKKLQLVSEKLKQKLPSTSLTNKEISPLLNYLNGKPWYRWNEGKRKEKLLKQINLWEEEGKIESEMASHMRNAVTCRHAKRTNFSPFDADNRNLTILATAYNFDNYIRDLPGYEETVSACQSGKDRDGIAMNETSIEAVASCPLLEKPEDFRELLTDQFAKSSHQSFMAGIQGGTTGCFGIKKDSTGAIPKRYGSKAKGLMIQNEASYNNKIYGATDPSLGLSELEDQLPLVSVRKWQEMTKSLRSSSTTQILQTLDADLNSVEAHWSEKQEFDKYVKLSQNLSNLSDSELSQKLQKISQIVNYYRNSGNIEKMDRYQTIEEQFEIATFSRRYKTINNSDELSNKAHALQKEIQNGNLPEQTQQRYLREILFIQEKISTLQFSDQKPEHSSEISVSIKS